MSKNIKERKKIVAKFQTQFGNNKMISQLIDDLPFMIGIFDPSGIIVYGNKKYLENHDIAHPKEFIGHYNLLEDLYLLDTLGLRDITENLFKGERQTIENFKTPLEAMRFKRNKRITDEIRLHNVMGYPIFGDNKKIDYLVITSQITNIYYGNKAIILAQEYMYENWFDDFNLAAIVEVSGLSTTQLTRVFKKHTGQTLYEYYKNIKIDKLKERLVQQDIKIVDAFTDCGIDYSGRYKYFFKKIVGMTPYEYKKSIIKRDKW